MFTYSYDGDGKRVLKSGSTIYWYGAGSDALAETDLTNYPQAIYLYFNGRRAARVLPTNEVGFYFYDHLGNTRFFQSLSGWNISDYYPFGGERLYVANNPSHYKFTGKERDPESGLDNFVARYYTSGFGRFLSPDPSGIFLADQSFPQSLNLYSYVMNNPLRFVDPSGLDCAYLNDNGSNAEWIDHQSDIGECEQNGGYWAYGYIGGTNWVHANANSDEVGIDSWSNGQMNWSIATQTYTKGAFPNAGYQPPWLVSDVDEESMRVFEHELLTFSGGPGNKPTCTGQALRSIAGELVGGVQAGAPAGETALKAAGVKQAARAARYAASRPNSLGGVGLVCPRCSSVFRSMMFKSAALDVASEAVVPIEVSVAAWNARSETQEQARNGECAAAFPIF